MLSESVFKSYSVLGENTVLMMAAFVSCYFHVMKYIQPNMGLSLIGDSVCSKAQLFQLPVFSWPFKKMYLLLFVFYS